MSAIIRRRYTCLGAPLGCALLALLGLPGQGNAGTWDLNLARLCRLQTQSGTLLDCGRPHDFSQYGGLTADPIKPDHEAFRSLMSELAVVFAPDLLSPAETVGFGGFHLSVDFGFTSVNPRNDANETDPTLRHRYWRAAEGVSNGAYQSGASVRSDEARAQIDRELPPNIANTVALMARKGFWFPAPSFELGGGVKHLFDSRMWAAIFTAKLALHEGFQSWALPALAIRGSGTRVFGTPGFDLTIAGLDFSASKDFGVASTFSLTPYLGYQMLWVVAESGTIDALPYQAPTALTSSRHFAFLDQSRIFRHRLFAGLRGQLHIATILAQFSYFVHGTDDDRIEVPDLITVEVEDRAGAQFAFNLSLGIDF